MAQGCLACTGSQIPNLVHTQTHTNIHMYAQGQWGGEQQSDVLTTPVIKVLWEKRQKDHCKFKTSLVYTEFQVAQDTMVTQ